MNIRVLTSKHLVIKQWSHAGLTDQRKIKQILQSQTAVKQERVCNRKGSLSFFCPSWDSGQLESCEATWPRGAPRNRHTGSVKHGFSMSFSASKTCHLA